MIFFNVILCYISIFLLAVISCVFLFIKKEGLNEIVMVRKIVNGVAVIIAILDIVAMFILAEAGYTKTENLYYILCAMICICLVTNALKIKEGVVIKRKALRRTLILIVAVAFVIVIIITSRI